MTLHLGPDPGSIARACALIGSGELVAFPTETVYGLGADATQPNAVAKVYAAKGRPSFNPLIAHIADIEPAMRQGAFNAAAVKLAEKFWPGPLTLVLPLRRGATVCELSRAGLESVGLRCPSHPVALALLRAFGKPVVGPSANLSGHVSPTSAAHVLSDLDGKIAAVIDGGASRIGIESTIVGCAEGRLVLLRPGIITRDELQDHVGQHIDIPSFSDNNTPTSPGRLSAHYAPETPVRLNATELYPGEALLAFGTETIPGVTAATVIANLSHKRDLTEAAARLYSALRDLDKAGATAIAVAPIPAYGLGEAIMDRLIRAATPSSFSE